jgi:hypothetical protein
MQQLLVGPNWERLSGSYRWLSYLRPGSLGCWGSSNIVIRIARVPDEVVYIGKDKIVP